MVKKRALKQTNRQIELLTEMLEVVLTFKILGRRLQSRALGLSFFSLMVNPRLVRPFKVGTGVICYYPSARLDVNYSVTCLGK